MVNSGLGNFSFQITLKVIINLLVKIQFSKMKIGILLFWAILFLQLISIHGINAFPHPPNGNILNSEAEPKIIGPENLCLVFGNVLGTYSAGGDVGDVFDWIITNSSGEIILIRTGGIQAETIQVVFPKTGNYTVSLSVRRGTNLNFYQEELNVVVEMGPELALQPDYLLCSGGPTNLTALNPATPNISEFIIKWKDNEGNLLGTGNELFAYSAGFYLVELFKMDPSGNPSCVINGTTFVGPPIDFQIVPSSTIVCEGESISFRLDTPMSGDWYIQKDFTGSKTQLNRGFETNILTNDLSGPGLYLVTFQTTTPEYPDCISEKIIGFEILETPELTLTILDQPDDCISNNGAFKVSVNSDVDAFYIPELNIIEGAISSGEEKTFSNLEPGVYSVVIEKNGCQVTQLVTLDANNSPTSQIPSVTLQNEICNAEGTNKGVVSINFGTTITNGEYRILAVGRGEIATGIISSTGKIDIDLSSGSYLLEMIVDGCVYPIQPISITGAAQVEFTVPSILNICENFTLQPATDQDLNFTLTNPDGTTKAINSRQEFTLTQAGEYSILGVGQNANATLCPKKIDFVATFSSAIFFSPILVEEVCFAPIKYEIDLQGIAIEDASIRWLNDQGEIVGRGQVFYPTGLGTFSLVVQPLFIGFCPVEPVEFEVVAPITSVPMELETNKICPIPNTANIILKTDENEVSNTEWTFFDENDQRLDLEEFDGLFEIEVNISGAYEVVAYNQLGCETGRNFILVEESGLLTLPKLDESYGICSEGKTGPVLDPGSFEKYFWYLEEDLISTNPQFSPYEVGEYSLKVITADGCKFSTTFRTYDACSFSYVFPNAMVLGDSERNFEVTVSEGITSVELFIINRQGSLVHYDQSDEIPLGESVFIWDGKVSGAYIPSGTYVIVLIGKNPLYQFEQKITGSLLVIE